MKNINIVLIMPDQWRHDYLGIHGNYVYTPFIDELINESTVFLNAYSNAPTCIPARAAMATGKTPSHNGRIGYLDGVLWNYDKTFMQILKDNGYQTISVGKTHFYPERICLGFEHLIKYEAVIRGSMDDYHPWLNKESNSRGVDLPTKIDPNALYVMPFYDSIELHPTSYTMNSSIERLEKKDPTRPFFIQIGFQRPHLPIDPPIAFYEKVKDLPSKKKVIGDYVTWDKPALKVGDNTGTIEEWRLLEIKRGYVAQLAHIDYEVGKLVRWLKKNKEYDNTCIIFLSDHGEMLGDHALFAKGVALNQACKIPWIMKLPKEYGEVKKHIKTVVSQIDLMPTVLDIANIEIPSFCDGESLIAYAKGEKEDNCNKVCHCEHSRCQLAFDRGWQMVTDGKYKYIWMTKKGRELFFDLINDPYECHDLSKDERYFDLIDEYRKKLVAFLKGREADGIIENGKLKAGVLLPDIREPIDN